MRVLIHLGYVVLTVVMLVMLVRTLEVGDMLKDWRTYVRLKNRLPWLFQQPIWMARTETQSQEASTFTIKNTRPITIFEKATLFKSQLQVSLKTQYFKDRICTDIDNHAEQLALDEEYSDGAIPAIISHIQKTHRPRN